MSRAFSPAVVLIVLLVGLSVALAQGKMGHVDRSWFPNPSRPPSVFPHDLHNEKADLDDCSACHHIFSGKKRSVGESSEGTPCVECHPVTSREETNAPGLMKAFHGRCKGCHEKVSAGPVMCGECHKR